MAEYASLSVFYRYLKEEISSYFFQSGYNLADDYNADKSEIGYSYVIDTRDDPIDTTRGWTFSLVKISLVFSVILNTLDQSRRKILL